VTDVHQHRRARLVTLAPAATSHRGVSASWRGVTHWRGYAIPLST
jgi:hypothetical protein